MFIIFKNRLMKDGKDVASMYDNSIIFHPLMNIHIKDGAYYLRNVVCGTNHYYCPGDNTHSRMIGDDIYTVTESDTLYPECIKIMELRSKVEKSFGRALNDVYQFSPINIGIHYGVRSSYCSRLDKNFIHISNETICVTIQVADSEEIFNNEPNYALSILDQMFANAARCPQKSARN